MAKGLRSTVKKRNRAKMRTNLYGPADQARTERLSAKLQEIASQPAPLKEKILDMEVDVSESRTSDDVAEAEDVTAGAMDTEGAAEDTKGKSSRSKSKRQPTRSDRVQKRSKRKAARSSIVFPQHPQKAKRLASKRQKK